MSDTPRLRVHAFSVSVDGYGAGPRQDAENPLGVGGLALHGWSFATRAFQRLHGGQGGAAGVDDDFIERGFRNVGAWIIGRNMFGPVRADWAQPPWNGWWGEDPPYHVPVFVLTHYQRPPLVMAGGTVFHFVTDGIEAALSRARQAAAGKDVRLGGGVAVLRQYLRAGLVDEMHLAIAPVLLGAGEALLAGIDLPGLGYRCTEHRAGEGAMHIVVGRDV